MPISDDDEVSLRVEGDLLEPIDGDGVVNHAVALACFRKVGRGDICGQREISPGYEPDEITLDGVALTLTQFDNSISEGIHNSIYALAIPDAEPGDSFQFCVNGFTDSIVTMPERFMPKIHSDAKEISLITDVGIPIQWEKPAGTKSYLIDWRIKINTSGPGCSEVTPDIILNSDPIPDSGSIKIESKLLPLNLPAQGCEASVRVSRILTGHSDPGLGVAVIQGRYTWFDTVHLSP